MLDTTVAEHNGRASNEGAAAVPMLRITKTREMGE
jgi:hypothetical protein